MKSMGINIIGSSIRKAGFVLGLSCLATGCATFPGNKIPDTPRAALVPQKTAVYHIVGFSVRGTDFMGGDTDDGNCISYSMFDCFGDGTRKPVSPMDSPDIPLAKFTPYADLSIEESIHKLEPHRLIILDRGDYKGGMVTNMKIVHTDNLDGGYLPRKEIAQCSALVGSVGGELPMVPSLEIRKAIPSVRKQLAKSSQFQFRLAREPPSWKQWDWICEIKQPTNAVIADIELYSELRYGLPLTIVNAVVTGLTLTLVPTVAPGDYTMTLRLRTLDGKTVWEQSCKESVTVAVGLPAVFWAFSKTHNIFTGPQYALGNQFRYLLKETP